MAHYLVTGGAGFIGSNIVEELVKRRDKVRVLDNFSTGKRENLFPFMDKIELVEGDIRSYYLVRTAVDGIDFILHQAALPSVPRSIKDPITTNEVNITGTLHVLEAAREVKVKRVVFASSSSIYGDIDTLPKSEDMLPKPLSPYAVSKLAGEKYCQVYTQLYGLKTIVLRYFNVFGPRQDPNSQYSAVIPKFIQLLKNSKSPTIYGDGKQSRDFTYIDNVVQANLLSCEKGIENVSGEVFNIACGKNVTIDMLVKSIQCQLKSNVKPNYTASRPGDVKHSLADIEKASQFLDYIPNVSFLVGLKRVINFTISKI